jgi:hypothetical protein
MLIGRGQGATSKELLIDRLFSRPVDCLACLHD